MANVIKHKRGSGSDPSASNLVVGELAIRTDTGKLFTKMDSGAIAEIAGGGSDIAINTLSASSSGSGASSFNSSENRFQLSSPPTVSAQQLLVSVNGVIQKPVPGTGTPSEGFSVDGNDIIFSSPPETGADFFILTFRSLGVSEPADNSVTSAKIVDGAIVNADINASAAIAGSKISPNFGSQNIINSGNINTSGNINCTGGQIAISGSTAAINFTDSDSNPDYRLVNSNGIFKIRDSTSGVDRLKINTDGHFDFSSNVDFGAGIDVTGTITSTGDITITDVNPALLLVDSNNNSDYELGNQDGTFRLRDSTNTTNRMTLSSTGQFDFEGNVDCNNGLDVTGAITGSGDLALGGEFNMTTDGNKNRFIDASLADNQALFIRATTNGDANHEDMALFHRNLGVDLFFDGQRKFKTISTGARIENTGTANRLGTTAGDSSDLLQLHQEDASNVTTYDFMNFRFANGNTHAQSEMRFRRHVDVTDQGYFGLRDLALTFGYGSSELMRLTHGGNLGIGIESPAVKLDVRSASQSLNAILGNFESSAASSGLSSTTVRLIKGTGFGGAIGGFINQGVGSGLLFNTINGGAEATKMSIKNNGFVGIGDDLFNPSYRLHVKDGGTDLISFFQNNKTGDGDIGYISVGLNNFVNTGLALFGHTGHTTAANQAAWFGLAGDDVAGGTGVKAFKGGTIQMNGVLNIGNNNQPRISGSRITTSGGAFGAFFETTGTTAVNGIPLILNRQADNGVMIEFKQANNVVATILRNSSNFMVYGGTSDYRLKENNVAISDSLTKIKSLKPYEFNWKDNPDTKVLGFFAHELQEVVPQAVTGTKDEMYEHDNTKPKYQNVDNSHIVPLLVAAVQELTAKVEALEAG